MRGGRSPIAAGSRKKGIQQSFGLGGLGNNVVMPPEASIQSKAKILSRETVGDGLARNSEGSGRESAGARKEDDLGFRRVEGESTCSSLVDKAVDSVLDLRDKNSQI